MNNITLKKGREASVLRQHPWIFSGALAHVDKSTQNGTLVRVTDHQGAFVAVGHYQTGSLAVKVLSLEDVEIDQTWFDQRLRRAMDLRTNLGFPNSQTNAYRLVHGEGDRLPGLIIDVFADVVVIQPHSPGMEMQLPLIQESLLKLGFQNLVHKPVGQNETEILLGEIPEEHRILEHGLSYKVDVIKGQKTGFFLDQRDNRALIGKYTQGKRVLNAFSYSGGFSIASLAAGADHVVSLDASASALALAEKNAEINKVVDRHVIERSDAVKYLDQLEEAFDVIVLDPPAFAKHKSARHRAIQAYKRINASALKHLPPGGILFTFSCSQVIEPDIFLNTVASAAIQARVSVQVMQQMQQPVDHPVHLAHPEGRYLKGLIVRKLPA